MNQSLQRNITAGSVLKFAFPSIVMMVVMSLYTVVDGTFISRLVGTDAFSAVNIMYPMLSFTIGLGTMFGTGITAIASKKLGEGKQREANENFTMIIGITILLGIVLSIICLIFLDDFILLLGANDVVFGYCRAYAFPLIFFFFANILQFQFQNLYIANGKSSIGLILTCIGGVTNIILDYVFIAIFDFGITGAAIATGIGYLIPAIYGLCYFTFQRKGMLYFVKPTWKREVLVQTMTNGSSEMVNYLSTSITTLLFNIIMMKLLGQEGVAAIAILLYLDFILVAISMGYSIGVAPLISFHDGAKQYDQVRKLIRISVKFCLSVGVIMTIGTIVFASPLVMIFTGHDSTVFALAVNGLSIFAFGYLCKGMNIFASAMFTAFGNGRVSATISFMRTLVFLVCSLLILSHFFKVQGVWFATPLAEALSLMLSLTFLFRYRKEYHYGDEMVIVQNNCK